MKDNKSKQIAILERILSYAEFKKKHLPELMVMAEKLKKLKDEKRNQIIFIILALWNVSVAM